MISVNTDSTSVDDPRNPGHRKSFASDLAYWSHSSFLKDENGTLISAGSNSDVGQVSLESKNQLEAAVSNTQLWVSQLVYLPLLTFM